MLVAPYPWAPEQRRAPRRGSGSESRAPAPGAAANDSDVFPCPRVISIPYCSFHYSITVVDTCNIVSEERMEIMSTTTQPRTRRIEGVIPERTVLGADARRHRHDRPDRLRVPCVRALQPARDQRDPARRLRRDPRIRLCDPGRHHRRHRHDGLSRHQRLDRSELASPPSSSSRSPAGSPPSGRSVSPRCRARPIPGRSSRPPSSVSSVWPSPPVSRWPSTGSRPASPSSSSSPGPPWSSVATTIHARLTPSPATIDTREES